MGKNIVILNGAHPAVLKKVPSRIRVKVVVLACNLPLIPPKDSLIPVFSPPFVVYFLAKILALFGN